MQPSNTLRQPSRSTLLAIVYITVGILAAIWSAVWYFFMQRRETPPADWQYYVCAGVFFSGLAIMAIGFLVGHIGRQARQGDNPVGQVTAAAVAPTDAAAVAAVPGAATAPVVATAPPQVPVAAPPRPVQVTQS